MLMYEYVTYVHASDLIGKHDCMLDFYIHNM